MKRRPIRRFAASCSPSHLETQKKQFSFATSGNVRKWFLPSHGLSSSGAG
jgi:hypothetical protein